LSPWYFPAHEVEAMTHVIPERQEQDERRAVAVSPQIGTAAGPFPHWDLDWPWRYVAILLAIDTVSAGVALAVGWAIRFGFPNDAAAKAYLGLSFIMIAGWLLCLQAAGAYEVRRISVGTTEFQRVFRAGVNLVGLVAITGYVTGVSTARTFVAIAIPLGALQMLAARWITRRLIHARRRRGGWKSAILIVGTSESARHLAETFARIPEAGLAAVGACVEDAEVGSEIAPGVPVLGDLNHAAAAAEQIGADVVAVAGSGLGPRRIRELGWALEGTSRQLVMAPGLTEIAGPRVDVSPVEGLPLMWVDPPRFTGFTRFVKRSWDVAGAILVLALGSPVLILIALGIRLTSRGPALFRQKRLGKDGTWVTILKFRTMYVDSERRRDELLHLNESPNLLLFKIRDDPRITPFGRVLRRFSLDELPQLFNVLGGSMSLVGPRPLVGAIDLYADEFRRRLMVKPGLTGLWQVSGRSNLTADDAIRLDLYYVENWSLAMDLAIIVRTVWVVLRSRGAY
jgi:exopolysaccharide biosynthesis polyprenyl glycosylphosphotransferase